MSIVDPLRRAPARQCRKIKTDRLGSELRPAQIDPAAHLHLTPGRNRFRQRPVQVRTLEPEDVVPAWKRWSPILLRPEGLYGTRPVEGRNKAVKLKAIVFDL
jgi:hypothetical protein